MSFSYDPSLATDRDWVRFLVSDRDEASAVLHDEEIDALLVEERNKYLAAARAGEHVLARTDGVVEKQVEDLRLRYADRSSPESAYRTHLDKLRERGAELLLPKPRVLRVL